MRLYSHSRLWLFENCPEAYKAKYVDKVWPEMPLSMSLFLGSLVHDSLEELYRAVKERKGIEMDELIRYFAENWKSQINDGVRIMNGETKDQLLNKGIKFLMDYYQKHYPFKENTVELEKKIIFPLDDKKEFGIMGYIDRLVLNDENEFEVHDYKTNAMIKRQVEVDKDRQLAFYHLGLKEAYGDDINVKLIWHFLAHNKDVISHRSDDQLEELKKSTLKLIRYIEVNDFWPSCGKKWCDWCSWRKKNGETVGGYVKKKEVAVNDGNLSVWI